MNSIIKYLNPFDQFILSTFTENIFINNRIKYLPDFIKHYQNYRKCMLLICPDQLILKTYKRFGKKTNRLNKRFYKRKKGETSLLLIKYRYQYLRDHVPINIIYTYNIRDDVIIFENRRIEFNNKISEYVRYKVIGNQNITPDHIRGINLYQHLLIWLIYELDKQLGETSLSLKELILYL